MRIFRPILMSTPKKLSRYHNWTREELISRLHQLEETDLDPSYTANKPSSSSFSLSSHPRRKIALKFSYSGSEYNGLAFQRDYTPLPTVEGVLFDALAKTRLIDPEKGFEGCQWERCGRTDKGVSAAGQVVSLWVRSAIGRSNDEGNKQPESEINITSPPLDNNEPLDDLDLPLMAELDQPFSSCVQPSRDKSIQETELPYIQILNRVLPSTIRVICWSPVSDTFSARFSCRFRHYKYFFLGTPDLDVSRMRDAAARLVGTHDFRNLCTLDGSKQIENYNREVRRADISPVGADDSVTEAGGMFVLDLVGNAFLYNQVRSIMAILFLVGAGLEQPHVVSSLLNVEWDNQLPPYRAGELISVVDRKPPYQMADALPLVLWDTGYGVDDVQWRTDENTYPAASEKAIEENRTVITSNLHLEASSIYSRSRIRATIDDHFLQAVTRHHPRPYSPFPLPSSGKDSEDSPLSSRILLNIPLGGGTYIRTAKYSPLLLREWGEKADIINERWRLGRGKKRWEERLARRATATVEDKA